jgi:hypothetical protein
VQQEVPEVRPEIQLAASPGPAARLVVPVPAPRLEVQPVLELPVEREQEMERALAAQVQEQPGAVEAREPLQVEAAPPLGAAPGVGQESARAGSE